MRWIAVAGATGYLGKHVVRACAERGWKVRAIARSRARLGWAARYCDDVCVADEISRDKLGGVWDDVAAVYSGIGIREPHRKPTVWDVDYMHNHNVFRLAREAGVQRAVFIAAVKADRLNGVEPAMAREAVFAELQKSSMRWTLFRSTNYFSDMAGLYRLAERGWAFRIGPETLRTNPIHGADLAAEMARSLDDPARDNAVVEIGGPESFSVRELSEMALIAAARPPSTLRVPTALFTLGRVLTGPFNPTLAGYLRAVEQYLKLGDLTAPAYGTRRLGSFFRALRRGENPETAE